MFKMISKIKKLCSVALIPRILRDEVNLSPRKLGKRPFDGFWKMGKSTDSKDPEAECEKCKKLIEMVFGPEKPEVVLKQVEANLEDIQTDKIKQVMAPSIAMDDNSSESNSRHTTKKTKQSLETVEESKRTPVDEAAVPLDNILQSTTAKSTEEQLAQKLETIEEPGLVGAASPKLDGFNTNPKVLGDQEDILENKSYLYMKIRSKDDAMDEIAKKCIGAPPDQIDERILEEMRACGMLSRGQTTITNDHDAMKCNEKEISLETESEHNTLYYEDENIPLGPLHDYPLMGYPSIEYAYTPHNIYPVDFENIPLHAVEDGIEQNEDKTALEDVTTQQQEEKTILVSSHNSPMIDYQFKNPLISEQTCNNKQASEELLTEAVTTEEEKPEEIIKNSEAEIEKIRLTAAETSCLGIPGDTEVDPDFDHKHAKPEILPCHLLGTAEATVAEDSLNESDENVMKFSDVENPSDWTEAPDRPFNNPSTSISSQYLPPATSQQPKREPFPNTAISSHQNPDEYFDLSHINMEIAEDDYIISLSDIRSLAAYHQYTIITGTDETEESENILFSTKNSPEAYSSELEHTEQDLPEMANKDMSTAIGPLPQLKDMDEDLSLSEMLKKVRERNRFQYCREYALEAEPAEANKSSSPDKASEKSLGPGPCKPKPKPACPPPPPPCPCPCPPPCKPKDPCAKFTKSLIGDKIKETFTLVLQVAFRPDSTSSLFQRSKINTLETIYIPVNENAHQIERFGSFLLSCSPESKKTRFEKDDIILARDYEPWTPIPSWPNPKKEKKEPFVCPKEGCKIIPPPRLNAPCKDNPCIHLPKRTLSLTEFVYEPLYVYDHEL